MAKYQVCNAVLNFVIRFFEGLCGINVESPNKNGVAKIIATLRSCVGTGKVPQGFSQLVDAIKGKVEEGFDKKIKQSNQTGKLNTVFTRLKDINATEEGVSISGETTAVENFLSQVERTLETNNSGYFATYCDKLKKLLENNELKDNTQQNSSALTYQKLQSDITGVTAATTNLNNDIRSINTNTDKKHLIPNAAVFSAVRDAAKSFIAELQAKAYMSFYNQSENPQAKWSQGFLSPYVDTNKRGAQIASSAFSGFTEFGTAATSLSSSKSSYASFTKELQKNVTTNGNNLSSDCPLSALFYGASYYFRYQQITTAKSAGGTPKTIREMLYFLAALQFSPQYDAFDGYVTEYFKTLTGNKSGEDFELKLQVADSGITSKPGSTSSSDTLSAADLKSYLASTFVLPPSLLGWLQGHSASISDEPWLHSLFSNSQLNLSIPSSGPGIFGALSNYAYALQFQLHFLYQQCSNTYTVGCGWNQCTFGKDMNKSSKDSCRIPYMRHWVYYDYW
ncbi:variant erythrocyte surface antigen-1, alpha subunit [Babesia caballi]|uniref:Variant erythrocyte surface antigen-1, alpha subunit n=1 Tax=Babesia caballi TaxID=5871 RepID=A0AAV4LRT8_BABCB|nr:variant erythrocyte surface antigen-1, alpha subunit [Babesia caballi]